MVKRQERCRICGQQRYEVLIDVDDAQREQVALNGSNERLPGCIKLCDECCKESDEFDRIEKSALRKR